MEEILKKIPARESQLNQLINLFGDGDEPLPPSLFISGNMSTGKSYCIETILRFLKFKYVVINCVECYSSKILFEAILSGLHYKDYKKCDSVMEFLSSMNHVQKSSLWDAPIVIVLDKAERLRKMDQSIMCSFLRLRELSNLNVCTIFVSHIIYDHFYFNIAVREPIKLYFPNYSKEELFKIIFLRQESFIQYILNINQVSEEIKNELEKPELFANFLNAFLSVFYRACRDLIELQHMAQINFVKYCEPIVKTEIKASDLSRLWRHISPILKTSLELLYLRIDNPKITNISPGKENNNIEHTHQVEDTLKEELMSTKSYAQSFELPYYTKFLLIAAYLASYNPPKEDKRLFMKHHGKKLKRVQQVKSKAKLAEKLNTQLGPKAFSLDRLLAIFYAILEDKIGLTSNLLAQIATLVELKFLAGSKEIDLDAAKYKCIVGYDFISAVAQTVSFNIRKYLYDFI